MGGGQRAERRHDVLRVVSRRGFSSRTPRRAGGPRLLQTLRVVPGPRGKLPLGVRGRSPRLRGPSRGQAVAAVTWLPSCEAVALVLQITDGELPRAMLRRLCESVRKKSSRAHACVRLSATSVGTGRIRPRVSAYFNILRGWR